MSFGGWGSNSGSNSSGGSNSGGFGGFGGFGSSTNTTSTSSGFGGFGGSTNSHSNGNSNSSGFGGFGTSNGNSGGGFGNSSSYNVNIPENGVSFIPGDNANHNANKDSMMNLSDCPTDSITNISCSPATANFAVSSWDGNVYIYKYDGASGQAVGVHKYNHDNNRGVLSVAFDRSGNQLFSGGCDNTIKCYANGKTLTLGKHAASVKCLRWWEQGQSLVSGSWDGYVKIWDMRTGQCSRTINCGDKVYCLAVQNDLLMVGVSNVKTMLQMYEFSKLRSHKLDTNNSTVIRNSALHHQLKCLDLMPRGTGFAVSGIEGRCAIEYWKKDKKITNFSFKCHRQPHHHKQYNSTSNDVFAVNAIRFHKFGGFATAGDDGCINTWDEQNRTRLKLFERLPLPVVDVDYTHDGNIMVYGTSYTWAYGISQFNKQKQRPRIYLHKVERWEVDPNCPNPNNNK